jgi:hypothetical protein
VGNTLKVLRYTRLKGYNNPEFFLVERDGMYYVLFVGIASGVEIDVKARGKSRAAVEREYELAVENEMRGTGVGTGTQLGSGHDLEIATTKMDAMAKRHLKTFDHPFWGIDWGTAGREAAKDIGARAAEQFHKLLSHQVSNWKGSSNGLHASKHRYWPTFEKMVQAAVRKKYGSRFKLYRGIHGKQAEGLIKGEPLDVKRLSSWTNSLDLAKQFRSYSGERVGHGSAWVIVSKVFSPKDVALAPVELPEYEPDQRVLMPLASDVYGQGAEFIVHVPSKKIAKGKFKIESQTRARRYYREWFLWDLSTSVEFLSEQVSIFQSLNLP